jgi:hypothetical protein
LYSPPASHWLRVVRGTIKTRQGNLVHHCMSEFLSVLVFNSASKIEGMGLKAPGYSENHAADIAGEI